MEILKNIIAHELFLYLSDYKALVISDIHAGYEESLHSKGIFLPKSAFADLSLKIERTICVLQKSGYKTDTIILNGDLVHSFSKHTLDEKYALKKLIAFLEKIGKIIIIKGNHDKVLDFIIKKDIKIFSNIRLGEILITHGDMIDKDSNNSDVKTIIIGHEHPSITLKSGVRSEKFKCFLKGKYKNKNLILMPSSNVLVEGSDVLKERLLTPYVSNINNFEAYVVGDKIYSFGKIKTLLNKFIE